MANRISSTPKILMDQDSKCAYWNIQGVRRQFWLTLDGDTFCRRLAPPDKHHFLLFHFFSKRDSPNFVGQPRHINKSELSAMTHFKACSISASHLNDCVSPRSWHSRLLMRSSLLIPSRSRLMTGMRLAWISQLDSSILENFVLSFLLSWKIIPWFLSFLFAGRFNDLYTVDMFIFFRQK